MQFYRNGPIDRKLLQVTDTHTHTHTHGYDDEAGLRLLRKESWLERSMSCLVDLPVMRASVYLTFPINIASL
jgi:hypothetical protein